MAVAIMRDDLSASDLRQAAARCDDSAQARRALVLALVLEGKTRRRRPAALGWTARRCATRCTATMKAGWRGCVTVPTWVRRRAS